MKTVSQSICPIHQIPLKDGICPICEEEKRGQKPVVKKIVAQKGGHHEPKGQKKCPKCGQIIQEDAKFCIYCGADLSISSPDMEKPNDLSADFSIVLTSMVDDQNSQTISIPLSLLAKPMAYYGYRDGLEFLYYSNANIILIANPKNKSWYLPVNNPTPIYNGQEIRFGEIGFIMKYAGETIDDVMKTQLLINQKKKEKSSLLLDCLECVHPNFKGRTINIEQKEYKINRTYLTQIFGLSDEKYLKTAGVSSKSVLLKKLNDFWYVFPEEAPNIFLKIPTFPISLLVKKNSIFIDGNLYSINIQ